MPLANLEDSLESPSCSPAVVVTPELSSGTKVTALLSLIKAPSCPLHVRKEFETPALVQRICFCLAFFLVFNLHLHFR